MSKNRLIRSVSAVLGLLLLALGLAAPASAASRDGICDAGEFCYYYNSNHSGSISDFSGSLSDYGTTLPSCYVFKGAGSGQGQCIKNNSASVWNRSTRAVRVYYNTSFGGTSQSIPSGAKTNLNSTLYNENASHQFITTTTSYPAGDDYPYKGQTFGAGCVADDWNFCKAQCTSFAAWAVNDRLGVAFHNHYKGPHWGNAVNWDNAARSVGISVTSTPRAGDIAVRNSGRYGHVAFVTRVNPNGTFEVDEYNYNASERYSHRTTSVGFDSQHFDSFIHLK